jgi:hypothetical protein
MQFTRRSSIFTTALSLLGASSMFRIAQASQTLIIAKSDIAFSAFLSSRRLAPSSASLLQLVDAALAFYREVEASGLAASSEADKLLFQWGVYDWGQGANFEFDITRQFIASAGSGDGQISQLRFTVRTYPTTEMKQIAAGNLWCPNRAELSGFRGFILSSPAFRLASEASPRTVHIAWSRV